MRFSSRLLVSLAAACALWAAPAQAATPFTAGTGFGHDLAVGGDGTGHVVFVIEAEPADRIGYCRVPAGGAACDGESTTLDFPGPTIDAFSLGDHAQVFTPAANKVVVLASCFSCGAGGPPDRVFRWISTNNGVTFGAPAEVGDIALNGQAAYQNTGDVALGVEGGDFQAMSLPKPANPPEIGLGGGFPFVYSPSVVLGPGDARAVHAVDDLNTIKFAHWTDPDLDPPAASELNTLANWDTGNFLVAPEGDNDETHLSSGPRGVFLSYRVFDPGNSRVGIRAFDGLGGAFGLPAYAEGSNPIDDSSLDYPHHSQDPAGRLHVVWRTLYDGGRLRYSRSDDGAATFTAAGTLAAKETFLAPIVEAGPAGTGFAAWKGIGTSTIRVVAIDPQAESVPGGDVPGPPAIDDLGIGDRTLTPGQGTSFTFDSSEAGNAVLTFQRRFNGKRVKKKGTKKKKKRCKPVGKKKFKKLKKKKRCKGWKKIGEIRQAVAPGANTIPFSGRIAGRKLRKGRYRARLVVTDAAGNVSRTETITFRVVGTKKKKKRR